MKKQDVKQFEFFRFVEENEISVSELKMFKEDISKEIKRIQGLLIVFERKTGNIPEGFMGDDQHGRVFNPVHVVWESTVNPLMFFYQDPVRDSGSIFKYLKTAKTFEDLNRYLSEWISVLKMTNGFVDYSIQELKEREIYKPSILNTFYVVSLAAAVAGLTMFLINRLFN